MGDLRLPVFEGALDVLLQLVERRELDISTVSLAAVTEQYLEQLSRMEEVDPDTLADFLVIAAKLILLKSRALLPAPPPQSQAEPEGQSDEDLAQILAEYKRFKEAAEDLREMERKGQRLYGRLAPVLYLPSAPPVTGITIDALVASLRRALARSERMPEAVLERRTFSITDKVEEIGRALQRQARLAFSLLLVRCASRVEMVVCFLALLELLKNARVRVWQDEAFGEIFIEETAAGDEGC